MGIQINGQTDTISSTDGSLNIGGTVTVNVTGDATGLTGTPDITVGAVTASSAVISGDLTVNGTTTTLDTTVTEVDRLEVGANNSTVGVAITQSGSGDILRLYDGATQAVTVKDGGNVGIGTDNPGVAGIDILANSAAVRCRESGGADARLVSGGSISYFGTYSNHDLQFLTNGSNALRITSSGNVGIGLTNPNYRLVVAKQDNAVMIQQGTGTLAEMTNNTSQKLWFQGGNAELGLFKNSDGSYEYILGSWQSVTPIPLVFRTGNRVERMRIAYDGNIGIGTESPHAKLEVSGGQNQTANQFTDLVSISANANNDSIAAEVQLNFGISPSHTAEANRKVRIQSITHAGNATPLAINPAGGSVGIGSDNPSRRLHVQSPGSTPSALFGNSANNNSIEVTRTGSTGSYFQVQTYTNTCNIVGGPTLAFRTSDPVGSASTERLLIDSVGRVRLNGVAGVATFSARLHTDGNFHLRPIADVTGSGTGVCVDILSDDNGTVNDLALRGATTIFRNASAETLRISSDGAFGLSGANYGTSGQVLTSQGSGSAPQWATPTSYLQQGYNAVNLSGTEQTWTSIPSTCYFIQIAFQNVTWGTGNSALSFRIGDSGGVETSGYYYTNGYFGTSYTGAWKDNDSQFRDYIYVESSRTHNGFFTARKSNNNIWIMHFTTTDNDDAQQVHSTGYKSLSDTLDRVSLFNLNGYSFDGGNAAIHYLY